MTNLQAIKQLPYWNGVAEHTLDKLCNEAEIVHVNEGSIITEQFQSATDFYLLCDGSVDHYVTLLNEAQQPLSVGKLSATWSAIGWSGFIEPHRYTTQVRCSTPSTLVRWNYETLNNLINDYPEISRALLSVITETSKALLEGSRSLLKTFPGTKVPVDGNPLSRHQQLKLKLDRDSGIKYLNYSDLFQGITLYELKHLADHCSLQRYTKGAEIFSENEIASDVLMLVNGTVNLYYTNEPTNKFKESLNKVFVRSLSQPGQIISWASLTQSQRHDIAAIAQEDISLCCIPASVITHYCENRTQFAINFYKKLVQIIGSRLRATRALLIRQHTQNEQSTVSSLLHNLGPQLAIQSPLHKIPYLLKSRATQEDAFSYLDQTQHEGCHFEKNVAGLCSDLLMETRREFDFYKGLCSIYQMVVNSNKAEDPKSIRNKSAEEFSSVFLNTHYLIRGEENLPDTPGHIFILNHLVSHPYHKLPNGFEFSLDTHFVSSMILNKKYGDSGVRVVRKSRYAEFGHESYYQRLGHIFVYTNESQTGDVNRPATDWRDRFFNEATQHLQQGENIIICPEGTSYWSEKSPGPFKSGAFRLAAMQDAETLIVPIVVANFDKLLSETVLTAVIKKPFKIGDVIDTNNPDAMSLYLATLRTEYKNHIKEAQQLANNTW